MLAAIFGCRSGSEPVIQPGAHLSFSWSNLNPYAHRVLTPFRFYDPNGNQTDEAYPIEDLEGRRIACTAGLMFNGRPAYVSTILIAHAIVIFGIEGDKPFELQIRTEDTEQAVMSLRFSSRTDAELAHEAMVKLLGNDASRAVLEDLVREHGPDEDDE